MLLGVGRVVGCVTRRTCRDAEAGREVGRSVTDAQVLARVGVHGPHLDHERRRHRALHRNQLLAGLRRGSRGQVDLLATDERGRAIELGVGPERHLDGRRHQRLGEVEAAPEPRELDVAVDGTGERALPIGRQRVVGIGLGSLASGDADWLAGVPPVGVAVANDAVGVPSCLATSSVGPPVKE